MLTPHQIVSAGSSDVLYVVGTGACGRTYCLHLIRTTISGRKDVEVSLPTVGDLQSTGGYSPKSLSFANADDGYALVSATARYDFYATRDGATNRHQFSASPGLDIERINVSSNSVYATVAKCKSFDDDSVDVTVARSPLWPIHWTALRTPKIPNNGLNGGIPLVSVNGSSVWLSQWENNGEVI
ncbi:MAG: hypothetical protein WCA31_10575 [Acidimicrobiales bacterium]